MSETIELIESQWFKNGDHPQDYVQSTMGFENGELREFDGAYRKAHDWEGGVVRRFRHPYISGLKMCKVCNHTMHDHGWIDQGENGIPVCVGDFVVTKPDGSFSVRRP